MRQTMHVALFLTSAVFAGQTTTLTLHAPETAGICGFRALWDTPIVASAGGVRVYVDAKLKDRGATAPWTLKPRDGGRLPAALAIDALQRTLLIRFPDAAEKIASALAQGNVIDRVELVLPFHDTELWPEGNPNGPPPEGGYEYRANWGVDTLYRKDRPTWHAVAWALRKPWKADPQHGPTFNASVNAAAYWAQYGAADTAHDRFPQRFGPTEVSYRRSNGRMDVTAVLTDEAFGRSQGERLRTLADCGFLVRKWETYDHRYFRGAYEWATATGGRAIVLAIPSLVVTLRKGAAVKVAVPPPADMAKQKGGAPTAVMPNADALALLAERHRPSRPDWMPDWQWDRVRDLLTLEHGEATLEEPFWFQFVPRHILNRGRKRVKDADDKWVYLPPSLAYGYSAWIDGMLGQQPRGWDGFSASRSLLPWFMYRDVLPGPAQDSFRVYWTAWLMPDRETNDELFPKDPTTDKLIHPMYDQLKKGSNTSAKIDGDSYYVATGDWRGNKSFYRSGFTQTISTMNFNHTAAMGALLGGSVIGSARAMADGRHGVEHFPLRLWSWFDGSTQESIDHYYFAITLTAQKMIADFGPTPFDRLMGRSILAKSVDELAGAYHPGLRRLIAGASRTSMEHLLVTQDGLYHILHTLSPKGVLRDLGSEKVKGLPVIGKEVGPAHVGRQTLQGPWAPAWLANVVDEKPLPWEMTCAYKMWGGHRDHPFMRRTYLGKNYGLYSANGPIGFIPVMAQWRREAKTVERMDEIATMLVRYGQNATRLVNTGGGWIPTFGQQACLQHKGKLLVVTSPKHWYDVKQKITSLQSTIALYNYQAKPTWTVRVGGKPMESLPVEARASGRITVEDGVSYLGIVPLPGTDLGRDCAVRLSVGDEQEWEKKTYRAALVVDNYNLRQKAPLTGKADLTRIDRAWGGFLIEVGDADEYGAFDAFQKHIDAIKLDTRWDEAKATIHVRAQSGADLLEMGVNTLWRENEKLDKLFAYQKVNGEWPYLPKGIERDTPLAQQGRSGRLEKGGAVLRCEPGRMAYLQVEPVSGTVAAYNPLPDATCWSLDLPGGGRIASAGRLGMAHVIVNPRAKSLSV
ncbi:hypothetical protein HQ560_21495, partial [bacterium]|nr:hypothetical protein [bacterium]